MTENRKIAIYIRLSIEDENVDGRTKKESDSVTSQRILLKSFVIEQLGVDETWLCSSERFFKIWKRLSGSWILY